MCQSDPPALLSNHLDAPVVRHKTTKGFGHLLLNIPELGRRERWMRMIRFHQPHKRLLVYGHYPASHHNLKQLKRRYSTAAVVMPVRPLGALLCSLIHHTRRKSYGPSTSAVQDSRMASQTSISTQTAICSTSLASSISPRFIC